MIGIHWQPTCYVGQASTLVRQWHIFVPPTDKVTWFWFIMANSCKINWIPILPWVGLELLLFHEKNSPFCSVQTARTSVHPRNFNTEITLSNLKLPWIFLMICLKTPAFLGFLAIFGRYWNSVHELFMWLPEGRAAAFICISAEVLHTAQNWKQIITKLIIIHRWSDMRGAAVSGVFLLASWRVGFSLFLWIATIFLILLIFKCLKSLALAIKDQGWDFATTTTMTMLLMLLK